MTTPDDMNPQDSSVTEPLELADQGPTPVASATPEQAPVVPVAAPARSSSTRTILEIVGGVVAACLIVAAGVVGFAAGVVTSGGDHDGGPGYSQGHNDDDLALGGQDGQRGQGGQFGQQGPGDMMGGDQFGQGGQQGPGDMMGGRDGHHGMVDPDGDNWTGQNRQFNEGPSFGQDGQGGQQGPGDMMGGQTMPNAPSMQVPVQ